MQNLIFFTLVVGSFFLPPILSGAEKSEINTRIFREIDYDTLFKVLEYQPKSNKPEIRVLNKAIWQRFQPWSARMNKFGFLVSKPEFGFVYLPKEIKTNSFEDLEWLWTPQNTDSKSNQDNILKGLHTILGMQLKSCFRSYLSENPSNEEHIFLATKIILVWNAARDVIRDTTADCVQDAYTNKSLLDFVTDASRDSKRFNRRDNLSWKVMTNEARDIARPLVRNIWRQHNLTKPIHWVKDNFLPRIFKHKKSQLDIEDSISYTAEKFALIFLIKNLKEIWDATVEYFNKNDFTEFPDTNINRWNKIREKLSNNFQEKETYLLKSMIKLIDELSTHKYKKTS